MFVLLLLAMRVVGEWVEIAQHQHRVNPSRNATFSNDETINKNIIYVNYSLTERPWHRNGFPRIPHFGSIKRVRLQGKEKDIHSDVLLSKNNFNKGNSNENRGYESIGSIKASTIKTNQNIDFDEMKRKSNWDNFGRMNETYTGFHNPIPYFHFGTENTYSEDLNTFNKNTQSIEKKKYQDITYEEDNAAETYFKPPEVNSNIKRVSSHSDIATSKVEFGKKAQINIKESLTKTENKIKNNPSGRIRNPNVTHHTSDKTSLKDQSTSSLSPFTSKPVANDNINKYNFDTEMDKDKVKNETEIQNDQHRTEEKSDKNKNVIRVESENEKLDNNTKNGLEAIWKLMTLVTDTMSRNTRRNFRNKIKYLENLQNDIKANIAERLEQAWPDDAGVHAEGTRRRRAARGHVEFPSSESALMTISFLTFAVFLIKLVLQVINTYKNKTMMVTPAVVAAVGRTAASLKEQIKS